MEKLDDGTVIIRRDQPYETAIWLANERSEFRSHRFKNGQWWVRMQDGESPEWIRDDEGQLRSDVWNILSGQVMPRNAGDHQHKAFHPRKDDVDEIIDALRAYLFDSDSDIPEPADG